MKCHLILHLRIDHWQDHLYITKIVVAYYGTLRNSCVNISPRRSTTLFFLFLEKLGNRFKFIQFQFENNTTVPYFIKCLRWGETFRSLLVAHYFLLLARCSLHFARYFLLVARQEILKDFFLVKVNKRFSILICTKSLICE